MKYSWLLVCLFVFVLHDSVMADSSSTLQSISLQLKDVATQQTAQRQAIETLTAQEGELKTQITGVQNQQKILAEKQEESRKQAQLLEEQRARALARLSQHIQAALRLRAELHTHTDEMLMVGQDLGAAQARKFLTKTLIAQEQSTFIEIDSLSSRISELQLGLNDLEKSH